VKGVIIIIIIISWREEGNGDVESGIVWKKKVGEFKNFE